MMQALLIGLIATASAVCTNDFGEESPPVITLNGFSPVYLRCNQPYVELGAKANSVCDGALDHLIIVDSSDVDTTVPGIYIVTYTVSDSSEPPLTTVKTRTVDVRSDFIFEPEGFVFKIPYAGNQYFYDPEFDDYIDDIYVTLWECKQPYDDPGAFAFDDCEGNMTSQIVTLGVSDILTGDADVAYPVLYAIENPPREEDPVFRLRVVYIMDSIRPTISLYGTGYAYGNRQDDGYQPPEDWWWPACRARYNQKYPESQWNVASDLPTAYSGRIFIDVKEEWAAEPMKWYCNKVSYEDPGAIAIDSCEGVLEPNELVIALTRFNNKTNRESFVYVARVGDTQGALANPDPFPRLGIHPDYNGYRAYYFMRDSFGNLAFRQTRLIQPQYDIAIIGVEGTTVVDCGDTFSPTEGVLALDLCEGNITSRLVITGSVNTAVPGTYELLYRAQNNYGTGVEVTRRIDVVDVTPPQIILLNELGNPTTDPNIFVPWCAWRGRQDGGLWGEAWWNSQHWIKPYEGWIVEDLCDDNNRLTLAVRQTGRTAIRDALAFLQAPREQGVLLPEVMPYLRTYMVSHDVTDAYTNIATPVPRFVTIVPTRPEITLNGGTSAYIECGIPYTDPGINDIRDIVEGFGIEPCDSTEDDYFHIFYKLVPPGVAPDSVPYSPYVPGVTSIAIDVTLLGQHSVRYRATNPLGFEGIAVRTIHVEDNALPILSYDFINYVGVNNGIYEFDCLDEENLSSYLVYTADDSCDGDLTNEVEYEIIQEMLPNGTWIYTVILTVQDEAGNTSQIETAQFISISEDLPSLNLGVVPGAIYEGPFLLQECSVSFEDVDVFTALDGCGYSLNLLDAPPDPGLPGVWTWAWALDAAGKPLWQDNGEGPEPVAYTYDSFADILGDYLVLYIAFDRWSQTHPELDPDTGLPSILDAEGNLTIRDGSGNLTVDYARLVRVVDRQRPVITLIGDAIIEAPCGLEYVDQGATALDTCDGDITANIDDSSSDLVDVYQLGTYFTIYEVSDSSGNAALTVQRIVHVVDNDPPIISLLGSPLVTLECGLDTYNEAGVLASDVCNGDLTSRVEIAGEVDVNTTGDYVITYSVEDNEGNRVSTMRTVRVVDTTAPVLELLGGEVVVECGTPYEEPGYTAQDACAGDMTEEVVIGGGEVDTFVVGTYTITYTARDAFDNVRTVSRRVYVVDTTPPVIMLPGDNPASAPWGVPYNEPAGFTAFDSCDGDLTDEITVVNNVDSNTQGTYQVIYTVEDAAGNVAESTRTVHIVDSAPPTIELLGAAEVSFQCGSVFSDPGAVATDGIEGDISDRIIVITPPNMRFEPGVYTVIYRVTNTRGSVAEITRTVTNVDTTPPTITLRGPASVFVDCESVLFILDDYAIAVDSCDSRPVVTRTGDVDTGTPGVYTVLYRAEDREGNIAQQTLTVTVRNNCPIVDEGEVEPEGEGEGEGEPEECTGCRACLGCCPDEDGKWLPKNWMGDWLLIGLSMLVLATYAASRRNP